MELKYVEDLVPKSSYFSRTSNTNFIVLELNKKFTEIKFGENGKLKTLSFGKFSKQYFKDGIVVN